MAPGVEIPVPSASDIAGGISKQGLYFIIALLVLAVLALAVRLLMTEAARRDETKFIQDQRIADRDKFQDALTLLAREMHATVAENGKGFWAVQRELQRLEPPKPPGGT